MAMLPRIQKTIYNGMVVTMIIISHGPPIFPAQAEVDIAKSFSSFVNFLDFSKLPKRGLLIQYNLHNWQVSAQLYCGNIGK